MLESEWFHNGTKITKEQHWRLFLCKKKKMWFWALSFVKTWSTIQTDGLFLMGFHFPSILERAAAWLKYNRLHKMFYLPCEAATTLTSLQTFTLQTFSNVTCSSLHADDENHQLSLLLAVWTPPFFPDDGNSTVSGCVCQMQLPAEALNEVLSASLWYGFTFYFSPAVFPTGSVAQMCSFPSAPIKPSVVWSQYTQTTKIYFLHRRKKTLAQLLQGQF